MKEIREEMDQTYEVGYVKPTETNEILSLKGKWGFVFYIIF